MIQSILLFALGFLTAGLLALAIAPTIWRRAVRLTRKRVEASAPLSMAEIQAEKDRVRAEFAMAVRRLEIGAKAASEKAALQIIELSRNREELKSLSQQRMEVTGAMADLTRRANELEAEVRRRDNELQRSGEKLAVAETFAQQRETELEKLGILYDESSFAASSRQIDLVARESQIDRLRGDVDMFREQCEEAEARVRTSTEERSAIADELESEKRRAADLQAKIDAMFATLADGEEKLAKRDRDMARLNEQLRAKHEKEENPAPGMISDRTLFEKQLTELTRENRKINEDLAAARNTASDEARAGEALREQISQLAAQVVALTASAEGDDSPIAKLLATPPPRPVNDAGERPTSLADRVLALQAADSTS